MVNVIEQGLSILENEHRQNAKLIQGIPQNTHRSAPLATLGWLTMAAYVAIIKLSFVFRILLLPEGNIYRQITK